MDIENLEEIKNKDGLYVCPECGKAFKLLGIKGHYWRAHTEAGKNFKPTLGKKAWNAGLTEESDERIAKSRKKFREGISSGRIIPSFLGKTFTKEQREKISNIRKKYLDEHPEKVPYLLNHKSNGRSYPEEYFKELFEKENILFEEQFSVGRFHLDFANPKLKFYVEIDGEQHYVDERILNSDVIRNEKLAELGWSGIRIRWAHWQKLSNNEKAKIIQQIKNKMGS